ncbi:uncharacterized protein TNCV_3168331 [Trichonephila clavipes]|nr:uncharacterized protein TNCV_3168331 [Trichonephila clavipes]
MLIYEFPSSSLRCRANPNLFRRSFEPFDQMLYHRMVLEPHTAYPIPAGTRYILLTVQKTLFGLDFIPEMILPQLMENGFNLGDFRKRKRFDQKAYKLPPPTLAHDKQKTCRDNARPFTALSTPQPVSIPEPPELTTSQIPDPPAPIPPELTTPQILLPDPPEQTTPQILLPDPPEQTTPQILLPDPPPELTTSQILLPDPPPKQTTYQILLPDPPVVETVEPTLTDDSSMDQIMSSVFGDYLQEGIPSAHTQESQVLDGAFPV